MVKPFQFEIQYNSKYVTFPSLKHRISTVFNAVSSKYRYFVIQSYVTAVGLLTAK